MHKRYMFLCLVLTLLVGLGIRVQAQSLNDLWRSAYQNCSGIPCVNVQSAQSSGAWTGSDALNDLWRNSFSNCGGTPCLTVTGVAGVAYCADAGSTDAYACNISPAIASYVTGTCYVFKANTVNTGPATINFNSLGAKTIKKFAVGVLTDLLDTDIGAGQLVQVCYDGTYMQIQSGSGSSSSGGLTPGSATTIGTIDAFIDLNVANAAGTTLTAAILNTGTVGIANTTTWSLSTSPVTGMTVEAHATNRTLGGSVIVDEATYPTSHTSKAIGFDHTYNNRNVRLGLPATHFVLSLAGWITFGPPKVAAGSASIFDLVVVNGDGAGGSIFFQLNNGAGPGNTYAVNIESNPLGVTTHSAYITVVSGNTYWVALQADYTAGVAKMALFNPSFVQVGATVTTVMSTGEHAQIVRMGNGEIGLAAGTTTYFENWLVQFTNPVFPLGPTAQ